MKNNELYVYQSIITHKKAIKKLPVETSEVFNLLLVRHQGFEPGTP